MEESSNKLIYYFSGITGVISSLLGGYDLLIKSVFLFMMLDVVCGFMCAALFHKSKYSRKLSSNAMKQGLARKASSFILIILAYGVDKLLSVDYTRNMTCVYIVVMEGLSILEHMQDMKVPFPKFIKKLMEQVKSKTDEGEGV